MRKQVLLLLMLAGLSSASFAQLAFDGVNGVDNADGTGLNFNWERDGNWVDKGNGNAPGQTAPIDVEDQKVEIRGGGSYMSEDQNVNLSSSVVINRLYMGHGNDNTGSLTIKSGGKITANGGYLSVGGSAAATLNIEKGGVYETTDRVRISWEGARDGKNNAAGVIMCAGELNMKKNLEFQTRVATDKGSGLYAPIAELHILGDASTAIAGIVRVGKWSDADLITGVGKITIHANGTLIYTSGVSITSVLQGLIDGGEIEAYVDSYGFIQMSESMVETTDDTVDPAVVFQIFTTTITNSEYNLSVESQATLDFSVYPNPVNDNITIESKTSISNVQLFNSLGQQVLSVDETASVDVSSLNAGIYVLKATDANGSLGVKRLVKQ